MRSITGLIEKGCSGTHDIPDGAVTSFRSAWAEVVAMTEGLDSMLHPERLAHAIRDSVYRVACVGVAEVGAFASALAAKTRKQKVKQICTDHIAKNHKRHSELAELIKAAQSKVLLHLGEVDEEIQVALDYAARFFQFCNHFQAMADHPEGGDEATCSDTLACVGILRKCPNFGELIMPVLEPPMKKNMNAFSEVFANDSPLVQEMIQRLDENCASACAHFKSGVVEYIASFKVTMDESIDNTTVEERCNWSLETQRVAPLHELAARIGDECFKKDITVICRFVEFAKAFAIAIKTMRKLVLIGDLRPTAEMARAFKDLKQCMEAVQNAAATKPGGAQYVRVLKDTVPDPLLLAGSLEAASNLSMKVGRQWTDMIEDSCKKLDGMCPSWELVKDNLLENNDMKRALVDNPHFAKITPELNALTDLRCTVDVAARGMLAPQVLVEADRVRTRTTQTIAVTYILHQIEKVLPNADDKPKAVKNLRAALKQKGMELTEEMGDKLDKIASS